MATADPIRCKKQLRNLANYWLKRGNFRNYTLIVLGVYTALRISDLLKLKWADVYDTTLNKFRSHLTLIESKTGKQKKIALNPQVIIALKRYLPHKRGAFIFAGNRENGKAICRVTAWRIIKIAASAMVGGTKRTWTTSATSMISASATISPHSLRKTFGYFAWICGISPVMIMEIYNHSSYQITRRYLGVTQDDRDRIYLTARLS